MAYTENNNENRGYGGGPLEPFPINRGGRPDHAPRRPQAAEPSAAPRSAPSGGGGRKKKRRGSSFSRTVTILAVLLGVTIFGAFYAIGLASDLFGLNQKDMQVTVEVPLGTSTTQVGRLLGKAGVIDHPTVFALYSKIGGGSTGFQAGTYVFNSNMGYDQIILALRKGDSQKNVVTLTFYEGMSQREIGKMLEENQVCLASEFNQYLEDLDLRETDYTFANYLPEEDPGVFRPLEGYLFPDTYEFFVGERVSSVAAKFLSNFDRKMTDELYGLMKERGMSLNEVITLASIIQEECSNTDEMGMVSSVFHNRLADPGTYPKLQSDVTIFYVEKDIKPYLNINDQALYDRYNTYERAGLPVGPICNPGEEVIRATLSPEKSDYYFFLTDADGKYYYAVTYQEHLKNLRAAQRVGESHGIDTKQ